MDTKQKRTFLVFSRGIMPANLTLGSLFLDPANPLDGEHKRHLHTMPFGELLKWTGEPEREQPFSLTISAGRDWLVNAGALSFLEGGFGRQRLNQVMIAGGCSRRLQLKQPEAFLNEVILSDDVARAWLAKQLLITHQMYRLKKLQLGSSRHPRIWMVAGLQLISDAHVGSKTSKSSSKSAGIRVPMPDPIAAVAMIPGFSGLDALTLGSSTSRTGSQDAEYHHADERVWAAQFIPLDVRFRPASEEGGNESKIGTWVALRDPPDLGDAGMRGDDGQDKGGISHATAEIRGLENLLSDEDDQYKVLDIMLDVDWDLLDDLSV